MTILSKLRKVKKNPSKPSAGGNSDLVKDDVPKNDDRTNSYCHINMTSSESQIRNTSDKVAVFKNSTAILKVRLFKLKNIESQSKQKYPEKYLRDLECEFRTFVENVKMVANELGCQQNAAQGIQNTKTDMDDWLLTLQNGLLQNVDTVEFCMKNMMMYEESNKKLKEDYDALQKQMTSNEERHKLEDEQNKERYNKLLNYIKILENKKSAALQIIQQKEQQRYNKLKNQTETNVKRWEREKRESMRRYHDLLQNVKSLEKAKSTQIERLKQEQQKQNAILQNVQKRSVKLQRKNARANKQYRNLLQNLKCLEKTKSTLEVQEQQSKQNADSLEDINDSTGDILHKERLLIPELIPNMTMGSLMDGTHCTTPTQSTKKKKKKKKKKKAKGGDTEPVMETSGTVELNDGKEHNESPSAEYPATLEHEKTKNDMELGISFITILLEGFFYYAVNKKVLPHPLVCKSKIICALMQNNVRRSNVYYNNLFF